MGDPETDHRGTESNVAAFVLRPTITNGPVIGAGDIVGMTSSTELVDGVTVQLRAGSLRLDFDPNVGKEQRVTLFLNQLNAGPGVRPRPTRSGAPAGNGVPDGSDDIASVDIPFVRVVAGTYLVRAQVNGAESLLAPDGTGAFADTAGRVRMSAAIAPAAVESWWEANQRDLVGAPRSGPRAAGGRTGRGADVGGRGRRRRAVRARPPRAAASGCRRSSATSSCCAPASSSTDGSPRSSRPPAARRAADVRPRAGGAAGAALERARAGAPLRRWRLLELDRRRALTDATPADRRAHPPLPRRRSTSSTCGWKASSVRAPDRPSPLAPASDGRGVALHRSMRRARSSSSTAAMRRARAAAIADAPRRIGVRRRSCRRRAALPALGPTQPDARAPRRARGGCSSAARRRRAADGDAATASCRVPRRARGAARRQRRVSALPDRSRARRRVVELPVASRGSARSGCSARRAAPRSLQRSSTSSPSTTAAAHATSARSPESLRRSRTPAGHGGGVLGRPAASAPAAAAGRPRRSASSRRRLGRPRAAGRPAADCCTRSSATSATATGSTSDWGFAASGPRAASASRALFAGESGTGKTLAAEVLARELAPRPLPHRPRRRRQQVHRRDGEEPPPRVRRGRGERRDAPLRRGRRAVRQAQRGQGQPRPLRQHRGQLPAAADGGVPRPRDPHDQPAAGARPGVPAPAPLRRPVPVPRRRAARRDLAARLPGRHARSTGSTSRALARLNVAGGTIRNIALDAAFLAAARGATRRHGALAEARAPSTPSSSGRSPTPRSGWA